MDLASSNDLSKQALFSTIPKLQALKNHLADLLREGLIIAFSGGVDSSFLLWVAVLTLTDLSHQNESGRLLALLTVSASIPIWEIEEAKQFAASLTADLLVIESHELDQEAYAKNDRTRCYYCKSELFSIAKHEAIKRGYQHIAYGYNASDRKDIRFGHQAAQDNNIHAPLDSVGFEKEEIRNVLKEIGLQLADKPASPCLASRIMTGVRVTAEKLHAIQTMEAILRRAGVQIYRVRLHEEHNHKESNQPLGYFRIEVAPEEMMTIIALREELVNQARKLGYRWVNLDLSGYQLGGGTLST